MEAVGEAMERPLVYLKAEDEAVESSEVAGEADVPESAHLTCQRQAPPARRPPNPRRGKQEAHQQKARPE